MSLDCFCLANYFCSQVHSESDRDADRETAFFGSGFVKRLYSRRTTALFFCIIIESMISMIHTPKMQAKMCVGVNACVRLLCRPPK